MLHVKCFYLPSSNGDGVVLTIRRIKTLQLVVLWWGVCLMRQITGTQNFPCSSFYPTVNHIVDCTSVMLERENLNITLKGKFLRCIGVFLFAVSGFQKIFFVPPSTPACMKVHAPYRLY